MNPTFAMIKTIPKLILFLTILEQSTTARLFLSNSSCTSQYKVLNYSYFFMIRLLDSNGSTKDWISIFLASAFGIFIVEF